MSAIILAILGGAAYVMYHIVRAVFLGLGELGGAVIDSPATGKAFGDAARALSRISRKIALMLAAIPFLLSTAFVSLCSLLLLLSGTTPWDSFAFGSVMFICIALPAMGLSFLIFLGFLWLISNREKRGGRVERENQERKRKIKEAKSTYGSMLYHLLVDPTNPGGWGARFASRRTEVYERSKLRFSPRWPFSEYPAGKRLYEWLRNNEAAGSRVTHVIEWSFLRSLYDLRIWLLLNAGRVPSSFVVAYKDTQGDWRKPWNERDTLTLEACALTEEALKEALTKYLGPPKLTQQRA